MGNGNGNGVQTTYSYDHIGRTTRIHTWNSTATLFDLNYAYDPNGKPTSLNSGQETYGYDDVNRLTSASGPFGTLSYSYDQVGNRLERCGEWYRDELLVWFLQQVPVSGLNRLLIR